ncbi:aldolase [Candidatus Dependentiae bacterium]|nr:aldolase [Candidatus Dependentiae bacterium]
MLVSLTPQDIHVPLTVPLDQRSMYIDHMLAVTKKTGRLFLFAADQKIEHLNADFYGQGIPEECSDPEYLFKIASQAKIGAFATHLGLIARYAAQYKSINYIVKLNGKSNIVTTNQDDPISLALNSVEQVVRFKQENNLAIAGVGYTIYLGSRYEAQMLTQAAQIIEQAHAHGLVVILWIYPRGKAVTDERSKEIIAGAAGVGAALGADFVKVNPPSAPTSFERSQLLNIAARTAGRTGIICSGGPVRNEREFLEELFHQLHTGGARGAAVGRNIFQRPQEDTIKFCDALAALIIDDVDVQTALQLL